MPLPQAEAVSVVFDLVVPVGTVVDLVGRYNSNPLIMDRDRASSEMTYAGQLLARCVIPGGLPHARLQGQALLFGAKPGTNRPHPTSGPAGKGAHMFASSREIMVVFVAGAIAACLMGLGILLATETC